jgi:hypothetical protein
MTPADRANVGLAARRAEIVADSRSAIAEAARLRAAVEEAVLAMRLDSHRPRAERVYGEDADTTCRCCLWLDAFAPAPSEP